MSTTHVILADYNQTRRESVAQALKELDTVVHQCDNRIDAMGKYWLLYAEGILPRAVVASWLMDTPESRAFFSAVGREVDHTSLALFANVARLDPQGILICYTDNMTEAVTELESSAVAEKVMLVSACDAVAEVPELVQSDYRTRTHASKTSAALSDAFYVRTARLSR